MLDLSEPGDDPFSEYLREEKNVGLAPDLIPNWILYLYFRDWLEERGRV